MSDERFEPGVQTSAGLVPTVLIAFGRVHMYQMPRVEAKGLVVVFPGCARTVQGFWPRGPGANATCIGMPEDMSHTKQILNKGYAILVVTAADSGLCWNSRTPVSQAVDIIRTARSRLRLDGKPLFLLGASAGGGYISRLATIVKCDGLIIEVSTNNTAPAPSNPPTVWVTMQAAEAARAESFVSTMRGMGKAAATIRSPKRRITPTYFAEYLPAVSPENSAKVADALRAVHLIDASGNLLADPKKAKWQGAVRNVLGTAPEVSTATVRSSPIWQALNAAYQVHEHVATYTTAALEWLESGGRSDFVQIATRLAVTKPAYLALT